MPLRENSFFTALGVWPISLAMDALSIKPSMPNRRASSRWQAVILPNLFDLNAPGLSALPRL
jgi:hypothetical protein